MSGYGLLGRSSYIKLAKAITPEVVNSMPTDVKDVTPGRNNSTNIHRNSGGGGREQAPKSRNNSTNIHQNSGGGGRGQAPKSRNIPAVRGNSSLTPRKGMNPWVKRGLIGAGLLGLGYGAYRMLRPEPEQQQNPQYYPMPSMMPMNPMYPINPVHPMYR